MATSGPSPAPSPSPTAALGPPLLCWLFDSPAVADDLGPGERQALDVIDRVLAQPTLPPELLPRAASVVPQLIAMLRQDDLPVSELAARIARDPPLAAEVLRMAGSAFFVGGRLPAQDLPQAIQVLGIEGLQMAISRVLLRPLYQDRGGSLGARLAPRLWEHADVLSRHCAQAARQEGGSAFDGYLVGLLHDTGWTALLHALQRAGMQGLGPVSLAGVAAFDDRAHRLFGMAAESWRITEAFTAFAADARSLPLGSSVDPMARLLQQAQGTCMAELGGTIAPA